MNMDLITPIVAIVTLIMVVVNAIVSKLGRDKIVGNDLKHLQENVQIIISNQQNTDKKIDNLKVDVSYLKGAHETQLKIIQFMKDKY